MLAREFEQDANDLVLHRTKPLGATAPLAFLEQELLGLFPAADQFALHELGNSRTQFAVAPGIGRGECLDFKRGSAGVKKLPCGAGCLVR